MAVVWAVVSLLVTVIGVGCYSGGPPSSACWQMSPRHGVPSQTGAPPFNLTAQKVGTKYQVILQTKPGDRSNFKGFFIQARKGNSDDPVGLFEAPPLGRDVGFKIRQCPDSSGRNVNSAISHTRSTPFNRLVANWDPNGINVNGVKFYATVVKNFRTFWHKIQSPSL